MWGRTLRLLCLPTKSLIEVLKGYLIYFSFFFIIFLLSCLSAFSLILTIHSFSIPWPFIHYLFLIYIINKTWKVKKNKEKKKKRMFTVLWTSNVHSYSYTNKNMVKYQKILKKVCLVSKGICFQDWSSQLKHKNPHDRRTE